jgi:putative ABC transport system permease protein
VNRGLARLWVLGAVRRPLRAVVVVLTLAVMSVATVGSLVAADSLSRLFTDDAKAEWGAVDVEGHAFRTSVFDDSLGRYLSSQAGGLATAGATRLVLPSAVEAGGSTVQGLVLGLGPEEEGFPLLHALNGSADVEALLPDEVIVNARLATRLHLVVGDRVRVVVAVPEWTESRTNTSTPLRHVAFAAHLSARVAGVVADTASADLHRSPNVLLSRSVLQRATQLEVGKSTVLDLRASRPGKAAAKALIDHLDPVARRAGLALQPVKQDSLDTAAGEGGLFRSLLLVLALLVVLAAVGGAVDLVLSLVRERGTELAQLRAAGAPREALQAAIVTETAVYGVLGGALGAALALPFGHVVAAALADHLASLNAGRGREQVHLQATVRPVTVTLGVLVVVVTACLAGRSAARRALSAEPDQLLRGDVTGARALGRARPVLLLAAGSASLGGGQLYLGVTLLLASLWLWRRRVTTRRSVLDQRAAALGLLWAVAGAALLGDFSQGVQAGFGVLVTAGETAVGCATVLVLPRLRRLMGVVRLYAGRGPTQLALLSAGAQAERSRDRSGIGVAVVAGAVFGVVALSVLGSAAALPVARQSGGFAALGTAVADVDPGAVQAHSPGAVSVVAVPHAVLPERGYRVEDPDGKRMTVPYPVRLIAAEADLVSQQQWGLAASLPQYRTAAQALTAVITDGDKAVVDRFSRPEGAQPGDDVVLDLGAGPRRFRLVAVLDSFLVNGVFIGDAAFRDQGLAHGNTLVLARGTDPAAVARQVEAAGVSSGLVMKPVTRVASDVVAVNRSFTDVFALMVALALVVVVASMSAGVVRAARERRGELAVLRAAGLDRKRVALALAAEPLLVTIVGEAIGTGVGVTVLWVLFSSGFSDLPFVLDVPQLGLLLLTTTGVAALACVTAAVAAVRRIGAEDLVDLG